MTRFAWLGLALLVSCSRSSLGDEDEYAWSSRCASRFRLESGNDVTVLGDVVVTGGAHDIAVHGDAIYYTRVRGLSVQLVRISPAGGDPRFVYDIPNAARVTAMGSAGDGLVVVSGWPYQMAVIDKDGRARVVAKFDGLSFYSATIAPNGVYWSSREVGATTTVIGFTDLAGASTVLLRRPAGEPIDVWSARRDAVLVTDGSSGQLSWLRRGDSELRAFADVASPVMGVVGDERGLVVATTKGIASVSLRGEINWLTTELANHLALSDEHVYATRRGDSAGSDPSTAAQTGWVQRIARDGSCRSVLMPNVKASALVHANGELFVFVLPFFDLRQGDLWRVTPSACNLTCRAAQ